MQEQEEYSGRCSRSRRSTRAGAAGVHRQGSGWSVYRQGSGWSVYRQGRRVVCTLVYYPVLPYPAQVHHAPRASAVLHHGCVQ